MTPWGRRHVSRRVSKLAGRPAWVLGQTGRQAGLGRPPTRIFEDNESGERWYPDGEMNTCFNCVDRHVMAGHANRAALIYDSPLSDSQHTLSYGQLLDRVETVAGMMQNHGIGKGDRVIIYMPMIPETAIAALACARLGAVHSIVFGGFAAAELATRIDDATPKLILAASCGLEPGRLVDYKPLLDQAIELSMHKPDVCLIWQREQQQAALVEGRDFDWQDEEAKARRDDIRPHVCRWHPPTRFIFSTLPARQGSQRRGAR